MKIQTKLLLIATCSCFFIGCACVTSSYHYTRGTEALNNGDFPQAISELEQAVQLDPSLARNRTNLAAAYFANNELEKGWYNCRQSVRCPYDDGLCKIQFMALCQKFIVEPGLNVPGTMWEEISAKLGAPDDLVEGENHQIVSCTYGTCEMSFSHGRLATCIFR